MIAVIGFIVSCALLTWLWGPKAATADFGGLLAWFMLLFIAWGLIGIGLYA